jgi:hypothetical protein
LILLGKCHADHEFANGSSGTLQIDTTPPVVTESLANDTGSSASDNHTSNPALTGTGDANAVVTLKEGAAVLGTTTAMPAASGASRLLLPREFSAVRFLLLLVAQRDLR